jgi:hypothetical protein
MTLAMGGAALVLLVAIVFGVLLETFFIDYVIWVLALTVLVLGYLSTRGEAVPAAKTIIMLAGLAVGLLALADLIYDLRNGIFDDVLDIVAGLGYFIGAAAMAAGGWALRRT